jgi:hypothetical protein
MRTRWAARVAQFGRSTTPELSMSRLTFSAFRMISLALGAALFLAAPYLAIAQSTMLERLSITPMVAYHSQWERTVFTVTLVAGNADTDGHFSVEFVTPSGPEGFGKTVERPLIQNGRNWTITIPGAELWVTPSAWRQKRSFRDIDSGPGMMVYYNPRVGERRGWLVPPYFVLYASPETGPEVSAISPEFVSAERAVNVILPLDKIIADSDAPVKVLHKYVSDCIDFPILMFAYLSDKADTGDAFASYHRVSYDAGGIGLGGVPPPTSSRLKGIIRSHWWTTSDDQWLLHELGHHWVNYLADARLNLRAESQLSRTKSHTAMSDQGGMVDIYWEQLVPVDGGMARYSPAHGPDRYSDLELYLMGMISRDEFPPHWFYSDVNEIPTTIALSDPNLRRVTIDDIERVYGKRIPPAAEAQKKFRAAFILVSEIPATQAELHMLNIMAAHYASESPALFGGADGNTESSFRFATRSRGFLYTRLISRRGGSAATRTLSEISADAEGAYISFLADADFAVEQSDDLIRWTVVASGQRTGYVFFHIADPKTKDFFRINYKSATPQSIRSVFRENKKDVEQDAPPNSR